MAESAGYLQSLFGIEGKVIIVTGSTGGLGRAVAEGLFQAGANVVVNGRSDDRTEKACSDIYHTYARSSGLLACGGDMSVEADAVKMVEKTLATFGKIDVIVNNAGINLPEGSFETHSAEDWLKLSGTNLGGPLNLIRHALPHIKKSEAGRVINLSSIGGHVGLPNNALYTMTKGGIRIFTKSLASELAESGVTVNSISPGVMATPMNSKFTDDKAVHDEVVKSIPMRRMGKPTDLVGACIFLASDASSYVTGSDILVDGGYTTV